MKHPNFFIIGAPKCGTTSMAAWLSEHPQIFMSTPKEIDFFDTDQNLGQVKSFDQYLQIFQNAKDVHLAVGEASVAYLHSQVAVRSVLKIYPEAKFIVMLRNPVDMAPSYHGQLYWSGWEGIEDFESAWRVRGARELGSGKVGPLCTELAFLQYENMCKVGAQVERLLQTVNPAAVLFIVMEDLAANPLHEYQRVLEFLGVTYDGKKLFPIQNAANHVRSNLLHNILTKLSIVKRDRLGFIKGLRLLGMLANLNVRNIERTPMRPELRQELIEVFKDDVLLLSSLIGRDLSHWLR